MLRGFPSRRSDTCNRSLVGTSNEAPLSITVVGTVAFDAIQTPFGKVDRCIGGSATYFSVAASFFSPVNLVSVIGDDFTDEDAAIFKGRNINLDGMQRIAGAKSF